MGNLCTKLDDSDIPIIYQAELYNDDYEVPLKLNSKVSFSKMNNDSYNWNSKKETWEEILLI